MKVLQIGKYYPPYHGGIETVTQSLTEGLNRRGIETSVLCYSHEGRPSEDTIADVHILRAKTWGSLMSQPISFSYAKSILKTADRFDLLHIHMPNPLAEICTFAIDAKIPMVATFHSDIIRQKLLLPFYGPILNRFLNRLDRIVIPTPYHMEFSPFLPKFKSKCVAIPFGMDPRELEISSDGWKLAKEIKGKYGPFALFVGRLVPYKGCRYLIEAMKYFNGTVVIVGRGPLKSELLEQAKQDGSLDRIHFLDSVDDHKSLMAYYHACEFFVLPSINRSEAFGVVLLEAMASGKPVITTKIPSGVRFVNQENETGLAVEPCDSRQLAQAMNTLHQDEKMRNRMGAEARKRFLSLFTLDHMIESHCLLYHSILDSKKDLQ